METLMECGDRREFKTAILETVVAWQMPCGCKIVAKPTWVEYFEDGIGPEQLVCPYCKQVDPNLIYVTNAGMELIQARGREACDVRSYIGTFDKWVFPIINRVMPEMLSLVDLIAGVQPMPGPPDLWKPLP